MSAFLVLIVITFQIRLVSAGIGNETIKMKVQKGETVVLNCSNYEGVWTWSGPNFNNVGQRVELYFSNNGKNPNLNLTQYSLQENGGGYDLIIANILKKNTGSYICRFTKDGSFRETKYHVSLLDKDKANETTDTAEIHRNISVPKSKEGNMEQNSVFLLVLIPVVLIGGSFTIVGLLAKVKGITIGEMLISFPLSCRRDTGRHTAIDDITDLDVSEDTGGTSNYRNTNESIAVKLYEHKECTPGLHYAEVSIKPIESQQMKIHGIENRTIYTEIDHSLNRGVVQSDQSDNASEDDCIYIKTLDANSRNYENTSL